MHDRNADRRYCRDVLPRVSRTFAINIRMLPASLRDTVGVAYLLCRAADTLEDGWPGPPEAIRARFDELRSAIGGDDRAASAIAEGARALGQSRPDLELLTELPRVLRVYASFDAGDRAAIAEALAVMTEGMCRYAARAATRGSAVPYLDDDRELEDYCWVVAGCVGVMLTKLETARESPAPDAETMRRRLALAPVVGRALQLTNIFLDWPSDVRRGRCYVPAAWLAESGLTPSDLVGAARPEVRELSARLESLARASLARVPDYLALTPPRARRYRMFVLVPAVWALRSIEAARRTPEFPWGPERPKLSRGELWTSGAQAFLGLGPVDELRRCAPAIESPAPATA